MLHFQEKQEPFGLTSTLWKFKKICLKNDALTNTVKAHDVVWNIVAQWKAVVGSLSSRTKVEKLYCVCLRLSCERTSFKKLIKIRLITR